MPEIASVSTDFERESIYSVSDYLSAAYELTEENAGDTVSAVTWLESVGACVAAAVVRQTSTLTKKTKAGLERARSQADIAKQAKVSPGFLQQVLKGEAKQLPKIEDVLSVLNLRIEATCVEKDSPPVLLTVTPAESPASSGSTNDDFVLSLAAASSLEPNVWKQHPQIVGLAMQILGLEPEIRRVVVGRINLILGEEATRSGPPSAEKGGPPHESRPRGKVQ